MHSLEQLRRGELAGTQRLDLSAGLTEFPEEIFSLADSLEVLNLSSNQLSKLPAELPRLHKLKVLFCSDNRFTHLPDVLGQCSQLEMIGFKSNQISHVSEQSLPEKLRWLILTDNALHALPHTLGQRPRLQKLMLAGNQLSHLPESLADAQQLELIRIAANQFSQLPSWLEQLPRLAWLACAGNPLSQAREQQALHSSRLVPINRQQLTLNQLLGQGASGLVYAAHWQPPLAQQELAVKLFKAQMTSDGLPSSEMAACLAAGQHPYLLPLIAPLAAQAEQADGLVFERLPDSFKALAGPPSLSSCTRDCYSSELRLNAEQVIRLAVQVASALSHLHGRGILHGDLYAHNLLRHQSDCRLSDFGAATLLAPDSPLLALDIRAFGIFLEELLDHCDTPISELSLLSRRCQQSELRLRPTAAQLLEHFPS